MPSSDQISDDPGTILDSFDDVSNALKAARDQAVGRPAPPAAKPVNPASADEVLYRSPYRPVAPRITICDDGSLEEGELVYVRSDRVVIGRAKGDILIPADVAMSASHAEVARVDVGGKHGWRLRDLGSSNGTFARCRAVTLRPGMVILIGSKRYRFELPAAAAAIAAGDDEEQKTAFVSGPAVDDALPALVEVTPPGQTIPTRLPFRSLRVTIGRPGFGNHIELDDLCVAKLHAVVTRDASGVWQMQSQPSLNGLWAKIDAIKLSDNCLFQCGEQRFRFHL
jgi:pSer/pThr/pTyr-binding forkhead associated (FHA) protein